MSRALYKVGVQGWFRLRVFDGITKKLTKDSGWCHNLITNQGLDALATQSNVMSHFTVGTSSTAPTVTDTWVNAFIATTSDTITDVKGAQGSAPYYGYRRKTNRFDVGVATGNLSEVCVGWSATTGTAFSHELIRDVFGAPISITVLATEYLEFTYELRYIVPTVDITGTCSISGVSYDFVTRALGCTNTFWWADDIGTSFTFKTGGTDVNHRAYTGALGAITAGTPGGTDGGTNSGTTTITTDTYVNGNYYRDFQVVATTVQWNVSGGVIRCVVLGCKGNRWQTSFAKVSDGTGIGKTSANALTIFWRISWARA